MGWGRMGCGVALGCRAEMGRRGVRLPVRQAGARCPAERAGSRERDGIKAAQVCGCKHAGRRCAAQGRGR